MAVIVPIVSKFDDKGIRKAQSEFGKLGSSMKTLLGAAGLTVGLAGVTNFLKSASQAASDDAKSQILLAQQLRNTADATDGQIASVEKAISKMSIASAVADDQLRPAMASLVRATGDVTKAQDLLSLSLDVSAATGKDLNAVSLAIGKAVSGQTQALFRMIPGLKGSSDWMGKLKDETKGMADAAGSADPYMQITVIFDELQEQIGQYLLPAMKDLSTYLQSEEFAGAVDSAFDGFDKILGAVDALVYALPGLGDALNRIGSGFANGGWLKIFGPGFAGAVEILSRLKPTPATGGSVIDQYKFNTGQFGKKTTTGDKGPTGPSDADKKAAADAKAAADKAAKARQAIIDAAKKASEEAQKAFDELKQAVDDFNKSFAATADAFQVIFKFGAPLGEFEQQAVDAFQSMRNAAQEAFDAGLFGKGSGAEATLASLKAYANREQALLQGIAKQRDVLAKKISIAQAITSGVMGSLDLTSMLETKTRTVTQSVTKMVNGIALTTTKTFDEVVSGGLTDSFKKLVDKTKQFAANLTKLKALGLNGNLFKQIVDAGADAGNATAEAIIAGGAGAVNELNGLFIELTDAGASIAETATPVFYDLGENMTNSFIDGLRSQDQLLIDQAVAMAALFTAEFKKQLDLAIAPTLSAMQTTGVEAKSAVDLSNRPDPKRSPQRYAAWLESIGGIDPVRSPESYARAQTAAGATYNISINAGAITDQASLPSLVTNALVTANKQGLTGGLSRLLMV